MYNGGTQVTHRNCEGFPLTKGATSRFPRCNIWPILRFSLCALCPHLSFTLFPLIFEEMCVSRNTDTGLATHSGSKPAIVDFMDEV